VIDGDDLVVSGQKIWTSFAQIAQFQELLVRTDPTAPKHKGISIVLVPMDAPGITVRPLPEIVHPDHPHRTEVFFSVVRVPFENLVGQENDGWAMANGSLAHERGMVWVGAVMGLEESLERLLTQAPTFLDRLGEAERVLAVDQIVQSAIDTQAARCLGYRGFAKLAAGGTAPEQALMKLYASEARQRIALVAAEAQGADALEIGSIALDGHLAIDEPQGTWLEQYFQSFANTISAGTSEIQRNIIAERVLGLPRA
jgi:alkylation response protein AidB-like acyl-CoA dehydrogenase